MDLRDFDKPHLRNQVVAPRVEVVAIWIFSLWGLAVGLMLGIVSTSWMYEGGMRSHEANEKAHLADALQHQQIQALVNDHRTPWQQIKDKRK